MDMNFILLSETSVTSVRVLRRNEAKTEYSKKIFEAGDYPHKRAYSRRLLQENEAQCSFSIGR